MRVLLVAPPRLYWPYLSSDDNFLCPQNLAYLGAILQKHNIEVEILDCMPLQLGWQSLASAVTEKKPDIVAMGESHALYINEVIKGFKLVKSLLPKVITIGGGGHLTHLYKEYISDVNIDFIVLGEGELSFLELVRALAEKNSDFKNIQGIAFQYHNEAFATAPRELIADLDTLPLPAYDLLPMERYGTSKYLFSPGGATIIHSRGCTNSCNFCVWWTQMAEREQCKGAFKLKPRWRTRSVPHVMTEVELLAKKYNKKCLVFMDESWNIDPKFNDQFAAELLKRNLGVEWFAFMRADCVIRDEQLGILKKLVASGLRHVLIGIERAEESILADFDKSIYSKSQSLKAFEIFKQKYPMVFTQGTFIVGIREETKKSLWTQVKLSKKLELDFPAFHPLTPVPGTELYEKALKQKWLETNDWQDFNWATPVMSSKYMTREEIALEMFKMNKYSLSFKTVIKGLFCRYSYKRKLYRWWFIVSIRIAIGALLEFINPLKENVYSVLVKPRWYDK